jgi:ATP/maltotriose-dependent transcriptional regulator MalT
MALLRNALCTVFLTAGFAAIALRAQPTDVRAVVDRTQNDLRQAEDFERQHGKQTNRYDNAQRHLSDFDKDFTRGHFDKGKLSNAIDDVKNVVDHNTLNPEGRDALSRDLQDLRVIRAEHEK